MTEITFIRPIVWQTGARTHVGKVRKVNEDAILAKPDIGLWAVADGMGGHQVGDIASSRIVAGLSEMNTFESPADIVDAMEDCLIEVNDKMLEYASVMFEEGTMGSTLVTLVIRGRVGICMWVGDSRLYRYRNKQLVQLSRDHSQLEEMISMGMISRADAENHPQRNVITRAVGVEAPLFVDITAFTAQVGDTFLLCSDGLYGVVGEDEIVAALAERDLELGVDLLVNKALENGAPDNVSVILVRGAHERPAQ